MTTAQLSEQSRNFCVTWSLDDCRAQTQREPAVHQAQVLEKMMRWYEVRGREGGAGILVLPTGGGKTFTAVRFLCSGPLSEGKKVLWLAHTHHLLEQAFEAFCGATLGAIREPRRTLRLRVVSGTPGHHSPRDVRKDDDVLIATLQTVTNAWRQDQRDLIGFLEEAGRDLVVVFDEAHHSPAPTYRKLLQWLQAQGATVLGLTATPVYTDERKQGWLWELFKDGILAQARVQQLIAARILAKPIFERLATRYQPSFDGGDYQKWLGTAGDLPEHVVSELAENRERNAFIAKVYAEQRDKWGKTIIFTDRWYQCEAIAEALASHGVRAGSVYSKVDAALATAEQRNRRRSDENARVLSAFRDGELDVLINVRMLTEGTDVPGVQTVFLTRQTTSRILLTQMVGRALRGPEFGGTENAYIVSFEDDWRQSIQWAEFELESGRTDDTEPERVASRPPLHLVSIDLVKRLARQMLGGVNVATGPFLSALPVGWYRAIFDAHAANSEDVEPQDLLVLVYDDEHEAFETLIDELTTTAIPEGLDSEDAQFESHREWLENLGRRHLPEGTRSAQEIARDLFLLARHVAQRETRPQFYGFEVREQHDLDGIANAHLDQRLDPLSAFDALEHEYHREDRFWRTLYPRLDQMKHAYDGVMHRLIRLRRGENPAPRAMPKAEPPPAAREPDEHVKREVMRRDGNACLCCGVGSRLQVDHVVSAYHGGTNDPANLQTLCGVCNSLKDTRRMRFRSTRTELETPPAHLLQPRPPAPKDAANPEAWERYLRQVVNLFYGCAAVCDVTIGRKGPAYHNWQVQIRTGNPTEWLRPHVQDLLERIQGVRERGGKPPLESITFSAPGEPELRAEG